MWQRTLAQSFFIIFAHIVLIRCQQKNYEDLQLLFVNGNRSTDFEAFYFNETTNLLAHPDYDNEKPTILYGYGYTENFLRRSTQSVLDAYIVRGNHNLLVIEWSKYSGGNYYFEAIPNSKAVGDVVAEELWNMKGSGFNLDNFHLVGHSLGGQLVGFIGRNVQKYSSNSYKMPKITALDPAGPFFYGGVNEAMNKPLNKEDAQVVHVIHTDSNFFGAPSKCGTADFWPNSGKEQPACPRANWNVYNEENFCSHRRSWTYYSESVRTLNTQTFKAVPCASWKDFIENNCPANETQTQSFMGYHASSQLSGDFFLQTNPQAPFNRGSRGMYYDEATIINDTLGN